MLTKWIMYCTAAHDAQRDKSGKPYIYHPLRVMTRSEPFGEDYAVVGLFHDVIEDTATTINHLKDLNLSDDVIEAIDVITKKRGHNYEMYLHNCRDNKLASIVKVIDVLDNMDDSRLGQISDIKTRTRLSRKYYLALKILFSNSEILKSINEKYDLFNRFQRLAIDHFNYFYGDTKVG